jgi:hypothetical protein
MVSRLGDIVKPSILNVRPGPLQPVAPAPLQPVAPAPIRKKLLAPTPQIELPPKLGRPPTANDLIIKRTFDGLTPAQAEGKIASALKGPVAAENRPLVDGTIKQRVRDMQVALNNVFTPGTPNANFLKGHQPAKIELIGSMSSSNPIVYQVTKDGQAPRYFTKGWGGGFTELPKPPAQQVMRAEITLEPRGLRMTYPTWENRALAGKLSTITEL